MTIACGGRTELVRDLSDSADGPIDASVGDDATASLCSLPGGYAVCGGPNECPGVGENDACVCVQDPPAVGVCASSPGFNQGICNLPADGDICAAIDPPSRELFAVPFQIGVLLSENASPDPISYADYDVWTGDPLPTPTDCPSAPGIQLCGPGCPSCSSGRVCSGRSPTHPHGMCFDPIIQPCFGSSSTCDSGTSCFTFAVSAAQQPVAAQHGRCIPSSECVAAVDQLPGGAVCNP